MKSKAQIRRTQQDGAAMVEAIIVISVFILFFVGMLYMKNLYAEKLRVMRLSRASAVAYSLGACQAGDPLKFVRGDMSRGTSTTGTGATSGSPIPTGDGPSDGKTSNALSGASGKAGILGNPTSNLSLQGGAKAFASSSAIGPKLSFNSKVGSTSYIGCGDKVREGNFDDVIDYAKDFFNP